MVNDLNEQIAYLRTSVIGLLIEECASVFLANEEEILSGSFNGTLIRHLSQTTATAYNACSHLPFKISIAQRMCLTSSWPDTESSVSC